MKEGEFVLIKSQRWVEQKSQIEESIFLDQKNKIKGFFYIKNQEIMLTVGCNKKTYHLRKNQDRNFVLYQELKIV